VGGFRPGFGSGFGAGFGGDTVGPGPGPEPSPEPGPDGSSGVDRITFALRWRIKEGSALSVSTGFTASNVATAPTTAKYRVDDPDSGREIVEWTDLTPDTEISFVIAATANVCRTRRHLERRELVVMTDEDLEGQYVERVVYEVQNVGGIR
jgi:hypothetical protein